MKTLEQFLREFEGSPLVNHEWTKAFTNSSDLQVLVRIINAYSEAWDKCQCEWEVRSDDGLGFKVLRTEVQSQVSKLINEESES